MVDEKPKDSGLFDKFGAYIKKNREAEEKRRIKAGEKSLSEELGEVGSSWGKNLMKGMAQVGDEQEAKITGKKKQSSGMFDSTEDVTDEVLFGKKRKSQPADGVRTATDLYSDTQFIGKLTEFLRYVKEDDDVELYQHRGTSFTKVDHIYLGKLLTRFYGKKVTLKERDLSIK